MMVLRQFNPLRPVKTTASCFRSLPCTNRFLALAVVWLIASTGYVYVYIYNTHSAHHVRLVLSEDVLFVGSDSIGNGSYRDVTFSVTSNDVTRNITQQGTNVTLSAVSVATNATVVSGEIDVTPPAPTPTPTPTPKRRRRKRIIIKWRGFKKRRKKHGSASAAKNSPAVPKPPAPAPAKVYAPKLPYYVTNASDHLFNSIFDANQEINDSIPLLTLFTTLRPSPQKKVIHLNVIRNWAQFAPKVKLILYTTNETDGSDAELISSAKSWGWTVLPVPETNQYGTPYLKPMYKKAAEVFESYFYCYANGDLLFDDRIVQTLQDILDMFDGSRPRGILVVGRRKNYHFGHNVDLYSNTAVHLAAQEAILFEPFAEDYFIIARNVFPWDRIPNFVVGRPYYDNYMVILAKEQGVATVDATNTLMSLHLSGNDGDFAGQKVQPDKNTNREALVRMGHKLSTREGFTTACEYETVFQKNDVHLTKKKNRSYHFRKKRYRNLAKTQFAREAAMHQKNLNSWKQDLNQTHTPSDSKSQQEGNT